MSRRHRKCLIEGCDPRAQISQVVCKDHEGSAVAVTISREVVRLEREVHSLLIAETQQDRMVAARRFHQRKQHAIWVGWSSSFT